MKDAMRARDKARLGVIRMALAAIKQREIDERTELDEPQILAVIEKMVKQRRESIAQYEAAGRDDLAAQEASEITVLKTYMPEPLDPAEVDGLIDEIIAATGAQTIKDMGKVMGAMKSRAQGRVDMAEVGARVRARLSQST